LTSVKEKGKNAGPGSARVDLERIARGVRLILEGIGEDPEREGLQDTPRRVAEMYAELTAGMREDPSQHIVPLSGNKHDEMVIVEAEHTCMTLRGVKKSGAMTVTSAVLGGFRKDPRTRAEAMALITGKG